MSTLISVNNLTRRYGDICAVNNISFELAAGDILGFLGPNGAGKSSTMQMLPRTKYHLKHTTNDVRCMVKEIIYKVDVNTLNRIEDGQELKMNEIARVSLRTTRPLFFDSYRKNRQTGSLILIDEGTNFTMGVGMIV